MNPSDRKVFEDMAESVARMCDAATDDRLRHVLKEWPKRCAKALAKLSKSDTKSRAFYDGVTEGLRRAAQWRVEEKQGLRKVSPEYTEKKTLQKGNDDDMFRKIVPASGADESDDLREVVTAIVTSLSDQDQVLLSGAFKAEAADKSLSKAQQTVSDRYDEALEEVLQALSKTSDDDMELMRRLGVDISDAADQFTESGTGPDALGPRPFGLPSATPMGAPSGVDYDTIGTDPEFDGISPVRDSGVAAANYSKDELAAAGLGGPGTAGMQIPKPAPYVPAIFGGNGAPMKMKAKKVQKAARDADSGKFSEPVHKDLHAALTSAGFKHTQNRDRNSYYVDPNTRDLVQTGPDGEWHSFSEAGLVPAGAEHLASGSGVDSLAQHISKRKGKK
jgi:hypothetical protein